MLYKNYFMKLNFRKIIYAFIFLFVSFLLMRYYTYLGNLNLGIRLLKDFSSRGFLTFLIYFIFSLILFGAASDMQNLERAIFVILITFSIAFSDATVDYITGFQFSLSSLLINTLSAFLSFAIIILHRTYKEYIP